MMTWPVGTETLLDHNIEFSQMSVLNHSVEFSQRRLFFVLPKLAKIDAMIHHALELALAKIGVEIPTGITKSCKQPIVFYF